MKAMILAAGVGSRLRPLTDKIPKALVEVGGVPMLERIIGHLMGAGVRQIIINVHHKSAQIQEFLKRKNNFGVRIELSFEEKLLDTGGGLKKAAWFLSQSPEPFFLYNVDIVTNLDLVALYNFHRQHKALATLAVKKRPSSRLLLFDADGLFLGWQNEKTGQRRWAKENPDGARRLAFSGIHVISPKIFPQLSEEGAFSILEAYLRLAAQGEKILAYEDTASFWATTGDHRHLQEARKILGS